MRPRSLALLSFMIIATASAYPLQGGDENASVVLFGATRTPVENSTQEILKLDVGLIGTSNATYELLDSKDNLILPGLYRQLQPNRQLVYFLIPQDALFKLIRVRPEGGSPFSINWWATPKGTGKDVVIRYYGITDWLINPDEQGIVMQLRVTNNGTEDLYVGPENFTLLDQWGWPYRPTLGFEPEVISPGSANAARVKVGFTGVSLYSRPAALAYDIGTEGQILIDLEKDQGQLSDEVVYGANATQAAPAAAVSQAQPENTSKKILSLKERIAASKERLNATKRGLDASTAE